MPRPVLPEPAALQQEQQASRQSPQVLEQVSALQVLAAQAQLPQEAARTQQEREELQQREEVAEELPRQASGALP